MDKNTIDFAGKTQLVEALLACPTMRDRNTRNQIVDQMTKVRGRIPRSETDHIDVVSIVTRALDFEGGLVQLLAALRFYEGDSRHMQNVDALYKQHAIAHGPLPSGDDIHWESKTPSVQQATERPLRLFLCHASGDKVEVRNFYEHLQLDGMDPWLDEKKLLPGQQWEQEIPRAVRQADVVIVVLSHNVVNAQGYIHDEIRFALNAADKLSDNTIYIIPIKLEECDVPRQLARWQWVNLFDTDGYERLLQALEMRAQEIKAKPPARKSGMYNYVTQPKPQKPSSWPPRLTIGTLLIILVIVLVAGNVMGLRDGFTPASGADSTKQAYTVTPKSTPPTATSILPTSFFTPVPPTPIPTLGISSTYVNPIDKAIYVYVPAGDFIMGSSNEQVEYAFKLCKKYRERCYSSWYESELPQHKVYLDEYWIMETEVTNAQYRKFMDADGYRTKAYWKSSKGWDWRTENEIIKPQCWDQSNFNDLQQPVVCVSWYEAEAYANWLSAETGLDFGLPTEAQWEKGARGSDGRHFTWGNQWDGSRANYCDENCTKDRADKEADDGYQYTAPVGEYPEGVSLYGALDMAGNVWEWTADWHGEDYYKNSPDRNPTGPENGTKRLLRGGSWESYPFNVRAATRFQKAPDERDDQRGVGIRLVLLSPDSALRSGSALASRNSEGAPHQSP